MIQRLLFAPTANQVGLVLFGDGWNHGPGLPQPGSIGANLSCVDSECGSRLSTRDWRRQ